MNTRLILYVDEHWPGIPALPWVLLDDAGKCLQEGRSDPRHWPAASSCEVVLGGAQVLWLEAELPKAPRREQTRLLNYALEERLAGDPDTQHLTVVERTSTAQGQRLQVLVVDNARLRALIAQLEAIGRAPTRMVSAFAGIPLEARHWSLCVTPGGGLLLRGPAPLALVVDADNLGLVLEHTLSRARAADHAPDGIKLLTASGETSAGCAAAAEAAALPLAPARAWAWWEAVQTGSNLLHGPFAPHQSGGGWRARVLRPLQIAGVALVVYFLAVGGQVLWQRYQLHGIESRMNRLFTTTLPQVPAVSPAAQLHRVLEDRRAAAGRLREDDALSLLFVYLEARGSAAAGSLRGLHYEDGQLQLDLAALNPADAASLQSRLADHGVLARLAPGSTPRLTLTREVRQ